MKPVSVSVLFLVFLSLVSLSFSLTMVSNCSVISGSDTYLLTTGVAGAPNSASPLGGTACVKLAASNVVFDCNGFDITNNGTGGTTYGILLNGSLTNVTVRNCPGISSYSYGIYAYQSNNSFFTNNSAHDNANSGFYLDSSSGNNLTNNTACDNDDDFYLVSDSDNNLLANNNACNGYSNGFYVDSSSGNTVASNAADLSWNAFYLSVSDDNNLTSNTATNSSNHDFYLDSSSGNRLSNNTAAASQDFYLSSSPGNVLASNIAYDSPATSFYLASSDDNNLTNNTATNSGDSTFFLVGSSGSLLVNNTARGSSFIGFYISSGGNNILTNNTADGNSDYGFDVESSSGSILTNNTASNGYSSGFYLEASSGNVFTANSAHDNAVYGFYVAYGSSNNSFSGNSVFKNPLGGMTINASDDTRISADHYYNNTPAFAINSSGGPVSVNLSGVIFDNPAGDYSRFTNLSMNDTVAADTTYAINWSTNTSALPSGYSTFSGKFISFANLTPGVSLDAVVWTWTDSEVSAGGYNEMRFGLWKFNGTWNSLNLTPDTSANALSFSNLGSFSVLGILQFNDTVPPSVILSSPANLSTFNFTTIRFNFTATDDFSLVLNCSLYIDGTISRTNASTQNDTLTTFAANVSGGNHSWFVSCSDASGNSGGSDIWQFRVAARSSPPPSSSSRPKEPVEMLEVSLAPACGGYVASVMKDGAAVSDALIQPSSGAVVYSNASGQAFFSGCGMDVEVRAAKSGVEGSNASFMPCVACTGCTLDAQCAGNEFCSGGTCTPVACSCGVVQGHGCERYACCAEADCGAGETCENHQCIPAGCSSDSDCADSQRCGKAAGAVRGDCFPVTGECGYAANHTWVNYACGDGPGCNSCPTGYNCTDHVCVVELSIRAPDTAIVGESVNVTVLEGANKCGDCEVSWTSPSGRTGTGKTDANGNLLIPVDEKGQYRLVLVKDPAKAATVTVIPKIPLLNENQPVALSDLGPCMPWLLLLLLLIGLVLYKRWRDKQAQVKGGKAGTSKPAK